MEKESILKNEIRIDIIVTTILHNWKRYIKPMTITAVVTIALLLCIPRTYSVQVKLAPEYGNGGNDLSSMASMVGINLGQMTATDAIVPLYYPDLFESTQFCIPLFDVEVSCKNSDFTGPYSEYLRHHTDQTPWGKLFGTIAALFKSSDNSAANDTISPFQLTSSQHDMFLSISGNIRCTVDKKTDVISITTTAQDPLVAALLADSVMQHLQDFIIDYRTHKARVDCAHYQQIVSEKEQAYRQALEAYGEFADSNTDLQRPSAMQIEQEKQNELQNAYDEFSTARKQLTLAQTRLTERTPAFTVLQNATVPVKPSAPKRMIIVAAMLFLCFIATSAYLLVKRK